MNVGIRIVSALMLKPSLFEMSTLFSRVSVNKTLE